MRFDSQRLRKLNWLCFAIIVLIAAWSAWWWPLIYDSRHRPTTDNMNDFALNLKLANQVCHDQKYSTSFVYPLPAVLFWHAWSALHFTASAVAYLVLLPASLAVCLLLSLFLAKGGNRNSYDGLIAAFAFAGANYFALWDMEICNVNSVYLMLVLLALWCWHKERDTWAGIWLALSVALKIYSIAFLPLLLLRKKWRIAWVMVAAMLVLFLVVPSLYFGPHDTVALTERWLEVVRSSSRPDYLLSYIAYKVSLSWTALLLFYRPASDGQSNVADWNINSVALAVRLVQLAWLFLVALYFLRFRATQTQAGRERRAFALDCSVILLLPLPLSPFLQPHQGVVVLLPAVVLATAAFDEHISHRSRLAAFFALVANECLAEFVPHPWRGIMIMLTVAIYFAAVWINRNECQTIRGKNLVNCGGAESEGKKSSA